MKKILLSFIFGLYCLSILAQQTDSVIIFNTKSEILKIGKQVYLLEDKTGKLTLEDIQKSEYQTKFQKSTQEIPNFNSTSSTIWVKLTVANQTDERIYLEVAQALAWYIDFYKPNAEGKLALTTQTGMMRPFGNREVDNNFFLFELPTTPQAQTYYFSIQSDFPLNIPLSLAGKEAQMVKITFYNWFFGGFSGLMMIMFFYNLFVAYSVRDKLYLYYCAYLLANLTLVTFMSGNFGYKLNPMSYISAYIFIFAGLVYLTVSIFITSLLDTSKKSFFYRTLVFGNILYCVIIGINIFTGRYIQLAIFGQTLTLLVFIYILVYSIRLYRKGDKNARYVVFGFSFYLLGFSVFFLKNLGLIQYECHFIAC